MFSPVVELPLEEPLFQDIPPPELPDPDTIPEFPLFPELEFHVVLEPELPVFQEFPEPEFPLKPVLPLFPFNPPLPVIEEDPPVLDPINWFGKDLFLSGT